MGPAEFLPIVKHSCVHLFVLHRHACQRQVIRSVIRHREDACRAVVNVANVTDDLVEDNGVA